MSAVSVAPSFSRSADLVARSAATAFKAARGLPKPLLIGCGAVVTGMAVIIALTIGGVTAQAGQEISSVSFRQGRRPRLRRLARGQLTRARLRVPTVTTGAFSGIILPDLLIVLPSGLQPSDVAGLRSISGVRKMITFDGAQIAVDDKRASVIGVEPSPVQVVGPVAGASDHALWTQLAAGDFVASAPAATRLGLSRGSHRLTARTHVDLELRGLGAAQHRWR